MDKVDKETRSRIMQAIRSRGNKSTERRLRAILVAYGFRGWHLHDTSLPGTPDFVFQKERLVVFVDGCFWHGCPACYRSPRSSIGYWDLKIQKNIARDRRDESRLRRMGWSVIRIWEHSLNSSSDVVVRIKCALKN